MSSPPRIVRAGFGDGITWLTGGADLVGRGGSVLLRVAAWLVVISLVQAIPIIGIPLLVVLSPVLTAGLLGLFRRLDEGGETRPDQLFDGFRDPAVRTRLLLLGGLMLAGLFGALVALGAWLTPQMDMPALNALLSDPEMMEREPERLFALFEGVNLFGGLALAAIIVGLVLGMLYFATPLVFFWNWPVMAAALFSLRAMLVNWLAFLGFGLVSVGLLFMAGFIYMMSAGLLQLAFAGFGALLGQVLWLVVSLFIQLLFAAAQWRAFRQVFPAAPARPSPDAGGDRDPNDDGSLDV